MRVAVFLLVVLSPACFAVSADQDARREAVRKRGIERAYQRQIAKEWAAFTQQFVIRHNVPVYSGVYQVGWRVVVTPNYAALQEHQRRLDALAWNSMTDEQRRDYALFTIAHHTGVIAANTGLIIEQNARIVRGLDEVEWELRRQETDRMIRDLWPR